MDRGRTTGRTGSLLTRVVVGHALAYPIGFVWAVAALPRIVMAMNLAAIERAGGGERAVAWFITVRALVVFAAAYVVAHVIAVPWLVRPSPGTRRLFAGAAAVVTLGAVAVGAVTWAWLLRGSS